MTQPRNALANMRFVEFDPEDAYVSTKPDGFEDQEFEMSGRSAAREHYFDVGLVLPKAR